MTTHLNIVPRYEASLAMTVAGPVPLRIRLRPVDDLQPVSFIERKLLFRCRREGIESNNNVQHILCHSICMKRIIVVNLFLSIVRREPSLCRSTLSPPPSVVILFFQFIIVTNKHIIITFCHMYIYINIYNK